MRLWPPSWSKALVAVALIACASAVLKGSGSIDVPEAEIRQTVEEAMLTDDPNDCTVLYTLQFLEQTSGERGNTAIERCRDSADESPSAEEVTISSLALDGGTAMVTVEAHGGEMDGTVLRAELVRDFGRWKFNELLDADFDRPKWEAALKLDALDEGITARETDCFVARLRRKFTTAQLEQGYLAGRIDQVGLAGLSCLSAKTIRQQFRDELLESAEQDELPKPLARCLFRKMIQGRTAADLRTMLEKPDTQLQELSEIAALACVDELRQRRKSRSTI